MEKTVSVRTNYDSNIQKEKSKLKSLRLKDLYLKNCIIKNKEITESYNLTLAMEKRNLLRLLQGFNNL